MGIVSKYILISIGLITLLVIGLILLARQLTMKRILQVYGQPDPEHYQFWLLAMFPVLGYAVFNLPFIFSSISEFGSQLSMTSLFAFLICQIFVPVLLAAIVNICAPVATNLSRSIMFSIPVFLIHIYHVGRSWLFPLIHDLQAAQSPIREITFNFVRMELQVGTALLLEVIFISWLGATTIQQAGRSRLTQRAPDGWDSARF
jgi:hypothetical protein